MNDAANHAILVVTLYALWTIALANLGAKRILWDYDSFKEPEQ